MNGLAHTPFGLGTSGIGNLYRVVTDEDAREVVDRAWGAGVRYFDTAPHYGLGLAESRLGRALAGRPRTDYLISTKVGRVIEPNPSYQGESDDEGFTVPATSVRRRDFSAGGIRRSLADSLDRLGLERVDLLLLHDPEGSLDQVVDEAIPQLLELKGSGVVSQIGVGSKDLDALSVLVATGDMDVAMVAGRYTLLEQPALASLFPIAARTSTEILAVGVFNSGLLATGSPTSAATYEYGRAPEAKVERARELARVCGGFGIELPHAAVQFALRHPLVSTVALGIGRPAHVAANARWAGSPLPEELWSALAERGLIPAADERTSDRVES